MPASSNLAAVGAILNTARVAQQLPDDPKPWQCIGPHYLFRKPPWLVLRQQCFRLPTGREIPEYWISEYPPWVNVVAVTKDDACVLVRQFRPGIGAVHYELPAGVTEAGESIEAAAKRELLEETGFGGGSWRMLMNLSANPALQNNMTGTYVAIGVEQLRSPEPDQTEDLRVHLVKVHELVALIDRGDMIQALHVAPLLRYLLERTRL
jgi:8-oxo-dGTP pyrophosphatase MutT (NUDIX family)